MGDYDAFAGPRACQLSELVLAVCPFVCLHDCHGLGTLGHLENTLFCTLLLIWINKAPSPNFPPLTFERHLQSRDMSKVSCKTGQFESQRRVLRLVSYFYLTSRHTNIFVRYISFGHYKRGLHICVFIVQPTRHLLIILKPQSQILRCWLGTINGRASKVLIWTIYGEKI